MTKELRRLTIVMLAMFLALFCSTTWIQVVDAQSLGDNPHNRRAVLDSYTVQRGSIFAGNTVIASSTPSHDDYAWNRDYPDAKMWEPVTGYVNSVLRSATGIENAMDAQLSGTAGSRSLARINRIITGQPAKGSNVVLSLDPTVQKAAYDALGSLQGAVVAIEPKTGRILAMVTSPSYDTNLLASHDVTSVEKIYDQLLAEPTRPLDNRAIAGNMNPPGSTFKLVVASAAFSSGKYTPDSTFPNPASYTLPGTSTVIHNFGDGTCGPGDSPTASIRQALQYSCNIPMAQLAVALGADAIRTEAEKYGFNHSFDLPLKSTAARYPYDSTTSDDKVALSGFGQGDVLANPLQMAMVSAGIANGGVVMNPRMVDAVVAPDLSRQDQTKSTEFSRALSTGLAQEMTNLMVNNVQNGVADGARIEGVEVAGKTGTAQHNPTDPYTFWFTGFAPANDPKVAVAVVVENGAGLGQAGSSDDIAGPIAKKVFEAVLNK